MKVFQNLTSSTIKRPPSTSVTHMNASEDVGRLRGDLIDQWPWLRPKNVKIGRMCASFAYFHRIRPELVPFLQKPEA